MIEHHGNELLKTILDRIEKEQNKQKKDIKILELGNQFMNLQDCQNVTAKEYFTDKGYRHTSWDINGLDGAIQIDLRSELLHPENEKYKNDVVTDFGTLEHLTHGLINGLKNVFYQCKVGGYMLHKNPKTGNFPGHGHYYFTEHFWMQYAQFNNLEIVDLYEHPIYHNTKDGWEIIAVLKKTKGSEWFSDVVIKSLTETLNNY